MSTLGRFRTRALAGAGPLSWLGVLAILAACGGNPPPADNNPQNPSGKGPAPVSIGSAGAMGAAASYAILAKTGITNVAGSRVTGDIGLSPAAASFITGFALVADASNAFSTSASVVGKVYAANYAVP